MADITVKQLNKMLKDKGLYQRLYYVCKIGKDFTLMQSDETLGIPVFSSRDILTVRDYILDMK